MGPRPDARKVGSRRAHANRVPIHTMPVRRRPDGARWRSCGRVDGDCSRNSRLLAPCPPRCGRLDTRCVQERTRSHRQLSCRAAQAPGRCCRHARRARTPMCPFRPPLRLSRRRHQVSRACAVEPLYQRASTVPRCFTNHHRRPTQSHKTCMAPRKS